VETRAGLVAADNSRLSSDLIGHLAKNYDYIADVERDEEAHGAEVASSEKVAALAKARREVDSKLEPTPATDLLPLSSPITS
jgi:hypothetical protein